VIHFWFPRPNQDLSGCPAPGLIVARLALLAKHRDRIMLPAKDPKKIIRGRIAAIPIEIFRIFPPLPGSEFRFAMSWRAM